MCVNVLAGYFALFVEYLLKAGFGSCFEGLGCPPCRRSGRSVCFDAALLAAVAAPAVRVYDHVSQFGAVFVAPVHQLAVTDNTTTDSCTECKEDNIFDAFACPDGILAPAGHVCIVIEDNWRSELFV